LNYIIINYYCYCFYYILLFIGQRSNVINSFLPFWDRNESINILKYYLIRYLYFWAVVHSNYFLISLRFTLSRQRINCFSHSYIFISCMQLHNIDDVPRELPNLKWSGDIDPIISPVINSYWQISAGQTVHCLQIKKTFCTRHVRTQHNIFVLLTILKTMFYFILFNKFK